MSSDATMEPQIPTIDFSPFYGSDEAAKKALIAQIRSACTRFGFFQLINHGISDTLQANIIKCSQEFFSLPQDIKEKYDKDIGGINRGYERLRSQTFEATSKGDLKEGYYFGIDLPPTHPNVLAGKFSQGPNKYPTEVVDPEGFKGVVDEYFSAMTGLAMDIVRVICWTLDVGEEWIGEWARDPIATLRMLHYPTMEGDDEHERSIGAHTDFGALTILLQDNIGGLQVYNRPTSSWLPVPPTPGAFVINLGNMMMRWTNDAYLSNIHRVINKSGKERYSIPFFFAGNPDFVVSGFEGVGERKYGDVRVEDWMRGRYVDTYQKGEGGGVGDLVLGGGTK